MGKYDRYHEQAKRKGKENKDLSKVYIFDINVQKKIVEEIMKLDLTGKGNKISWKFNGRFKRVAGRMSIRMNGMYLMELSPYGQHYELMSLIDTVVHEIAHAVHMRHDDNHFILTGRYFDVVIKKLKDRLLEIANGKIVKSVAKVKQTEKIKLTKEFGSKKHGRMTIFVTAKNANNVLNIASKMVDYMESNGDNFEVLAKSETKEMFSITFHRQDYQQFLELYKKFKKCI